MASTNGYCTATEVREHLPKLTVALMADADMEKYINQAEKIINATLGSIYAVPFTTVPPLINEVTKLLAAYKAGRSQYTRDSQSKSDWIDILKEDANDLLRGIVGYFDKAENFVQTPLLTTAGAVISKLSGASCYSTTQDYKSTFDMDDVEMQGVDPDLTDAVADERD